VRETVECGSRTGRKGGGGVVKGMIVKKTPRNKRAGSENISRGLGLKSRIRVRVRVRLRVKGEG
jgi:hypothetical protein